MAKSEFYGLSPSERNRLLTETEAAELLGLSPTTLRQWRGKGIGPSFIRMTPKVIRYNFLTLIQYQQDNTHQNTIY
jgi:predicted site-specific integrase-resolvase